MKLKRTTPKLNISSFRRKKLALVLIVLLSLAVLFLAIVVINSRTGSNVSQADCEQTQKISNKLVKPNPDKYVNPAELRAEYDSIKQPAEKCQSKISKSNSELDTLTYNYNMAVNAYKFGDSDEAKRFADTTLSLNGSVDDAERKELPKKNELKTQMEAIKNGNY